MNLTSWLFRQFLLFFAFFRSVWHLALLRFKNNLKLHFGSDNLRLKDYLNVDILLLPNMDLVVNIKSLGFFIRPGNVSHIYTCHTLEHFSHEEVKQVLRLFHKLLKKKGELRISVPDMDKIVKIYSKNWHHFQTPGNSPWIDLIWGGQLTQYDFHKTGFNFCWLKYLLKQAGFTNIKEYNAPRFLGKNVQDASLAQEPFGIPFSLNVVARKRSRL